jgi:XrtJ-associated TM-motif-TM protein
MMKTSSRFTLLAALLLVPCLAHAQGGCVTSPECPTAVLGLVGAAGAALFARFRSR